MTATDIARSLQVAETLLGCPVRAVSLSASGANSRVTAIDAVGHRYGLKNYPDWRMAGSSRCAAEWHSLELLHGAGLTEVPRPIAHDAERAVLILEWIDGKPVDPIGAAELAQAAGFLDRIFVLSDRPEARNFPLASEACLSGAEIARQVAARRQAFAPHPALDGFLARRFDPVFAAALDRAQSFPGFAAVLPEGARRLIPADFGFHNALREADGRIRFFDFDYFGWDDPVKLTADFLLHPAMRMTESQKTDFAARMAALRQQDRAFADRLRTYLPLFALRWALIVLNVFRRDRDPARLTAAQAAGQLAKAEAFVGNAERRMRA